jgi:hypothetical protein
VVIPSNSLPATKTFEAAVASVSDTLVLGYVEYERKYVDRNRDRPGDPMDFSRHARPKNWDQAPRRNHGSDTRHEKRDDTRHNNGSDTRHEKRDDTRRNHGSDTRHEKRDDTRHERRDDTRHERRDDTRHERRDDTRHERRDDTFRV